VNQLSVYETEPGQFVAEGTLTFSSIDKKTVKSLAFTKNTDQISIDLAKIEASDSAGLALLIEWLKLGKQTNTQVTFKNLPQQLQALAKLSGFDDYANLAD
jgi:phospholipid transport system transporter-binding protein